MASITAPAVRGGRDLVGEERIVCGVAGGGGGEDGDEDAEA
jgi:hypothetical protein